MRANVSVAMMVTLALVLVALTLFIVFMQQRLGTMQEQAEEEACKQSIRQHSLIVRATGGDEDPHISCTAQSVTIDERDPEKAKRLLANELVSCWERWQRGEIELFAREGTYCNPCSVITLSTPDDLKDYRSIWDERMPRSDLSYREYLFPMTSARYPKPLLDEERRAALERDATLETGQAYGVLFHYDKNHSIREMLAAIQDDPVAVGDALDDLVKGTIHGAGTYGAVAAGSVILVTGVCTFFTGGICGIVVGAVTTAAPTLINGAIVVGAINGGGEAYHDGVPYPEWFAQVILVPHEEQYYRDLNCQFIHQEGIPERVKGAENI